MTTQDNPLLEALTERESDVLRLMCDGLTNRDISKQLVLSVETVRWYTKQIYSKLGVHSRAQAILRAQDLLLLDQTSAQATIEAPEQHNLPHYALSFVGRTEELQELQTTLSSADVRLVTIAGPGGMGKTRLAVELAHMQLTTFTDGVYFVPLSSLQQADELLPAIANAMSLRPAGDPAESLLSFLRDRSILLILDNLEHLTDAATVIAQLLRDTSAVKIVATSRASLSLTGEYVRYLGGVYVSQSGAASSSDIHTSAVQLFQDRARRVRADFDLDANLDCVQTICRLVDGMPLAIEIATAWLRALPCATIADEIRRSLDFLTTHAQDVDDRHTSIRAVFDYSWQLLSSNERRVLLRLALFRGGFGTTAAKQVAGASPQMLANLIDKSFLYQTTTTDGFFRMHDLLRQCVEEKLVMLNVNSMPLSTRSTIIATWSSFVRGDFEKAELLADQIIRRDVSEKSLYEQAFGMALLGVLSGVAEDYAQCQQLCEAAFQIIQQDKQTNDRITEIFTFVGLAIAACGTRDYRHVQRNTQAALDLAAHLQVPAFTTLCLPLIAVVFAHVALPESAVEAMALAHTHPASTPTWMEQWPLLQQLQSDLREELSASAYQAAWQRGTGLELDHVKVQFQSALANA